MVAQPVLDMLRIPHGRTLQILASGGGNERPVTAITIEPNILRPYRILYVSQNRLL